MKEILSVICIGILAAIGKMLLSSEQLSVRKILGRGILGATVALLAYPIVWLVSSHIPVPAALELQIVVGLGGALASIGSEILEKAAAAAIFKFTGKDINPESK